MSDVLMEVTRESGYPRDGRMYPKGSRLRVPGSAAEAMEAARPPYGRRVEEAEASAEDTAVQDDVDASAPAEDASDPAAEDEAGPTRSDEEAEEILDELDATEPALELAAAHGLDLAPYARQGSGLGGRIHKSDVERWLEESETETA